MDNIILNVNELNVLPSLTRVEVIDEKGRNYVNWNKDNIVRLSFQDNGRTLKIFINRSNEQILEKSNNKG